MDKSTDTSATVDERSQENPHARPYCIYLYHLTPIGSSQEVFTEAYFYDAGAPIHKNQVEDLVLDLVQKARLKQIRPVGWDVGDIRWRRISYLAFVVDDLDDELTGIEINRKAPKDTKSFSQSGKIAKKGAASGFWLLNEMKAEDGSGTLKGPETVKIRMSRRKHPVRGHEDSGTNMGPPVPPP
jgi:hypothetical protein